MRVLISAVLAAGLWSTPGFSATILQCGRLVDVRAGQILMNVSVVVDGPTIRGIEPGLTAGSGEDTVIDLRSKAAYDSWHFPDALFLDFPQALRAYGAFDAGQSYVLYCEFGLKSAHLADLMRRAGLEARHVSGGLREAKRLAQTREAETR